MKRVPFDYYQRLNRRQRRIYDASDRVERVEVPDAAALKPLAASLQAALEREDRRATERALRLLNAALIDRLDLPPLDIKLLAARPSSDWGELQGLYEGSDGQDTALVTLWASSSASRA